MEFRGQSLCRLSISYLRSKSVPLPPALWNQSRTLYTFLLHQLAPRGALSTEAVRETPQASGGRKTTGPGTQRLETTRVWSEGPHVRLARKPGRDAESRSRSRRERVFPGGRRSGLDRPWGWWHALPIPPLDFSLPTAAATLNIWLPRAVCPWPLWSRGKRV